MVLLSEIEEVVIEKKTEAVFDFAPKTKSNNHFIVEAMAPDCYLWDLAIGDKVVVQPSMVESIKFGNKTVILCPESAIIGIDKD